jgi:hypothetical protein
VRIWDLSPGYLNRPSLLGEHRELHAVHSIIVNGKAGYARHPETLRWMKCISGLRRRHAMLVAEMQLRGFVDRTPVFCPQGGSSVRWPRVFVTSPGAQFELLRSKYVGKSAGRIPLPRTVQELWAHHKYSVMARDPAAYRSIGRRVSRLGTATDLSPLTDEIVEIMRIDPTPGRLVNALEHLWGYVAGAASAQEAREARQSTAALLRKTTELALVLPEPYLLQSTALSDFRLFVSPES